MSDHTFATPATPDTHRVLADLAVRAGAMHAMTPDYAIHRAIAIRDGWIVAFSTDPLTCPIDELPTLQPTITVVGGRAVHDPAGRLR